MNSRLPGRDSSVRELSTDRRPEQNRPHDIPRRDLLRATGAILNRRAGAPPSFAARVFHPGSGRTVDCFTDQPGVQVYTSNYLDATIKGISGKVYRQGDAVTLETQHFPDSPNHPSYPSTVLRPGQSFDSTSVFRFSAR
ncbi:aldose epimerase family protein [Microlunatus elymi]|nr:hypothetical protein [Microlunatus elymi]